MTDLVDRTGLSLVRDSISSLAQKKVNDAGVTFELDDEAVEICNQRFGAQEQLLNNFVGKELVL